MTPPQPAARFTNKKNNLNRIGALLAITLSLTSCGENESGPGASVNQQSAGAKLVAENCKVCHAQGLNGAPIIGNGKMWAGRLDQGVDVLIEHAINGFGLMPPKGGKSELTDEEVAEAVRYMASQVQ